MKHYIATIGIACLFASCTWNKTENGNNENDSTSGYEPEESAIMGYMGDGTGMSCLEFITDEGDTMLLSRTSESGVEGEIVGDLNVNSDRFAVTVSTDSESVVRAVNMTQMMKKYNKTNH